MNSSKGNTRETHHIEKSGAGIDSDELPVVDSKPEQNQNGEEENINTDDE